jgi:hypothetical protein
MSSAGIGTGSKMVCDMDDHGIHGEMKNDALNVAATALETNQEEKDISKHIKVVYLHFFISINNIIFLICFFISNSHISIKSTAQLGIVL